MTIGHDKGHDKRHNEHMSDREVMKLALEALEVANELDTYGMDKKYYRKALTALRQALEQEPWDATDMAHRAGGLSMEKNTCSQ